jgi:hypothetical protein
MEEPGQAGDRGKIDRLRDAGLIRGELPEPYRQVFENLSDEEIGTLVKVKCELDKQQGSLAYATFIVPL